jgi:mono/diheme cytochrome c family protein
MKKFMTILGTVLLMIFAGTAFGEVVIKEEPLEWQDVAKLDGDELYSNLCAVCHGVGAKGDGPAVSALEKAVPDLTVLAISNDGVYPNRHIENVIFGRFRVVAHGTVDMPVWGEQFEYVHPGWSTFPRTVYAEERVRALGAYIESLQIDLAAENRLATK